VLAKGRRQGWSVNLGEYQPDVVSVASGFLLHGEAHAIVAGPYARVSGRVDALGRLLRDEARQLERWLSGDQA
jgi:DNA-binding IclR family transcriptional regulator